MRPQRGEVERHGLGGVVRCYWGDVMAGGRGGEGWGGKEGVAPEWGEKALDGIFLDLPKPWVFVENHSRIGEWGLKPGGMFCAFSPCVEQVQKVVGALRSHPLFTEIRVCECQPRFYDPMVRNVKSRSCLSEERVGESGKDISMDERTTGRRGSKRGKDSDEEECDSFVTDEKKGFFSEKGSHSESRSTGVLVPRNGTIAHTAFLIFARRTIEYQSA